MIPAIRRVTSLAGGDRSDLAKGGGWGVAASRLGMRVVPQCPHPCRQTLAAKNAEAGTRGGFG